MTIVRSKADMKVSVIYCTLPETLKNNDKKRNIKTKADMAQKKTVTLRVHPTN